MRALQHPTRPWVRRSASWSGASHQGLPLLCQTVVDAGQGAQVRDRASFQGARVPCG